MTPNSTNTQFGTMQTGQQQGQTGTAAPQQTGQHGMPAQMQQSGQAPKQITDWASI
ncbi:MAG: hypothetical protein ACMUJJ_05090 [Roseicyclus sp.]|jgi:hypothetical protein|uniref:hypothetical protein n=1 Tax=Roseicyclus sp. TaxID=1914329 RepID=UPI003A8B1043